MTAHRLDLLESYLSAGHKVARRLAGSIGRISVLFPLDDFAMAKLTEDDEERLDAFLHRFSSLAASVQDHVGRALLIAEEENLSDTSRKDQRQLLEKLGALDASVAFGDIAVLRTRLVHTYPEDPAKQAEILNVAFRRSKDLLAGYEGLLDYSQTKFGVALTLKKQGGRPA